MTNPATEQNMPYLASKTIQSLYPDFKPKVAIILGSGLGQIADELDNAMTINYDQIPGFPKVSVQGHGGNIVLGYCRDVPVICLQGRAHTYEGLQNYDIVKTYVRTIKLLGCDYFIATNASGSLREDVGPGELMLITDHINMQPSNPLIGPNDDSFGPRFYPLDNAYDKAMQTGLEKSAQRCGTKLHHGVYISVLGPHYETAAEIRAFKMWGVDAVGMSTVPEILVANHCGLKVAVIATITNYATGLTQISHSHEHVVEMAKSAASSLNNLLQDYISGLK